MFPRQGLFHTFSVNNPTINYYNLGTSAPNYGYAVEFNYTPTASTSKAQLSYVLVDNVTAVGSPEVRGELYFWNSVSAAYEKFAESNWAIYSPSQKGFLLDFKNSPTTLITDPAPNTGPVPMWVNTSLGTPQLYLMLLRTKSISGGDYFEIPYTSLADGTIVDSTSPATECNLQFISFNVATSALVLTPLLNAPIFTFLTDDVLDTTYLAALPYYDITGQLTDKVRSILPYILMDYARIATEGFAIGSSGFVNSNPQKPIIIDATAEDLIARRFPTNYTSSPVTSLDLAIINPVSYPSTGTVALNCKLGASDYNSVLGEVGIWAKLNYWDDASVGATALATIGIDVGDYFLLATSHFPAIVKTNNDALNLNVILAF